MMVFYSAREVEDPRRSKKNLKTELCSWETHRVPLYICQLGVGELGCGPAYAWVWSAWKLFSVSDYQPNGH